MKLDMWTIILIASLFLIFQGITDAGAVDDKKTAQLAQGEAAAGGAGLIAFAVKKAVWPAAVIWAFAGVAALIPFIFGQFKNLVSPPTIPTWVWIGAGVVMLFMMMSMKRR